MSFTGIFSIIGFENILKLSDKERVAANNGIYDKIFLLAFDQVGKFIGCVGKVIKKNLSMITFSRNQMIGSLILLGVILIFVLFRSIF